MSAIYRIIAQANSIDLSGLPHTSADSGEIQKAVSLTLAILGAISVLIIAIAGFRYITARGDPQQVATARSAIIYALIGLLVSASAFIIVNFVIGNVS